MYSASESLHECIQLCWNCRDLCQKTLFNHCLQKGGEHAKADHIKLMADCIEICQVSADFMVRQSPLHEAVCRACAEVCEACADSCDAIGGEEMKKCAEACRRCAESCRGMSGMKQAA